MRAYIVHASHETLKEEIKLIGRTRAQIGTTGKKQVSSPLRVSFRRLTALTTHRFLAQYPDWDRQWEVLELMAVSDAVLSQPNLQIERFVRTAETVLIAICGTVTDGPGLNFNLTDWGFDHATQQDVDKAWKALQAFALRNGPACFPIVGRRSGSLAW